MHLSPRIALVVMSYSNKDQQGSRKTCGSSARSDHGMGLGAGATAVPTAAAAGAGADPRLRLPLDVGLPRLHPEPGLHRVQRRAAQARRHCCSGAHPGRGGRVRRQAVLAGAAAPSRGCFPLVLPALAPVLARASKVDGSHFTKHNVAFGCSR